MPVTFTSHARTLEELKAEFVSDIHRRLNQLDWEIKKTNNASVGTRLATARRELEMLAEYWTAVTVSQSRRRHSPLIDKTLAVVPHR